MMKLTTEIEQLLANKDYAELNAAERALVAEQGSQEAYEQLRNAARSGQSLSAAPSPPPSLKASLMAAFRRKHQQRNIPLYTVTVPIWQAAAVTACMVLLGQFVRFGPVYAASPAIALEQSDSLWLKKVTQIMTDTAIAVFGPAAVEQAAGPPKASIAQEAPPRPELLPQPVSDTPGWAKRSAIGDREPAALLLMMH